MTMSQHTATVRTVYKEALEDLVHGGATRGGDIEELTFLHDALIDHGFGAAM